MKDILGERRDMKGLKDLTDPRLIKLKGVLFLVAGISAGVLLIFEAPTLMVGILLAVTVWCFCRFYYFAFYVIEKYVDSTYRFSGLWSFARYMVGKKKLNRR